MKTETIELMQNHSSVRHFKEEKIPREHLLEIVKAAQGAASSHFIQAYSIIHVTDEQKKRKITEYANNQQQISNCSDFLVFCCDYKRLEYVCKKHEIEIQFDHLESFIMTVVDTALIAQNALTAAESFGYGGCYIGGIRNNIEQVSDILELPDKVFPLFGMTLGIPAKNNEVKPRLPVEAILHENTYQEERFDTLIDAYDQEMTAYYSKRSTNIKDSSWTKEMAHFFKDKRRMHMKEFIKNKGFNL